MATYKVFIGYYSYSLVAFYLCFSSRWEAIFILRGFYGVIPAGLYTILGFEPAIFTSGESILNSFSGGFSAL